MKALAFLLLLTACGGDDFGSCPTSLDNWSYDCRDNVEPGTYCDEPQGSGSSTALPSSCLCNSSGFWECNSCPFYWSPVAPLDACTAGTTCVLNNWEHGCSCSCAADGTWSCSPDTIGSHCP